MSTIDDSAILWRRQRPGQALRNLTEKKMESLAGEIEAYERRRKLLDVTKTVVALGGVLLSQVGLAIRPGGLSVWMAIGSAVFIGAVSAFLVGYWKARPEISGLDRAEAPEVFIPQAIATLMRQKKFVEQWLRWLVLALIVSVDLMLSGHAQDASLREEVTLYGVSAILLVALALAGLQVRRRIFAAQEQPLIDRLNEVLRDLHQGS